MCTTVGIMTLPMIITDLEHSPGKCAGSFVVVRLWVSQHFSEAVVIMGSILQMRK